jgi:hypothetical protein
VLVKKITFGLIFSLLTLCAALPAQAQIAPEAGYWWDSSTSGSGFVIEIQGTTMFMAGFLYAASGEATWVASTGPMTTSSQYSGSLITYDDGQTLTGAYQAPSLAPALGTISISFSSNTSGTIVWPGGTVPIQRFNIVPGGVTTQQPVTNPQTGWWWNPNESGRGFAVEVQNGTMYFAGYMYDGIGNPIWYLSTGAMNGSTYQGELTQYANGQTLTGPYQVPSEINPDVGQMTLQFTDTADATFTLPGGRQIPLTRFQFGSSTSPTAGNVVPLIVDAGPTGLQYPDTNVPFVTVTICVAGTSNCQTIDHIDVDTGSSGLRIISSVLSPSLVFTQQNGEFGGAIGECTQFAIGYLWGTVKLADITIGGETARSVPIQIVGDPNPNFSKVPADCSGTGGQPQDTVQSFGANGIIGVGNFQADCGAACVQAPGQSPPPGTYYSCEAFECVGAFVPVSEQVQNPVGLFPVDNNGVLLQLPAIGANGAATVTGSLIFGIGTQANNALGSAQVMTVDTTYGYATATIGGVTYENSFVDSGSSAFFLPSSFAAACTNQEVQGYFCPPITLGFTGTLQGTNGTTSNIAFSVANALNLYQTEPNFAAFNDLAAANGIDNSIDLGLPFFFGRNVFSAIEGKQTPGGIGPFVAF